MYLMYGIHMTDVYIHRVVRSLNQRISSDSLGLKQSTTVSGDNLKMAGEKVVDNNKIAGKTHPHLFSSLLCTF